MPRIPRVPSLQPLQRGIACSHASRASPFAVARAVSTTSPAHAKGAFTDRLRSKLWKGEAPGPEDPYTQRAEPERAPLTEAAPKPKRTARKAKNTRLVLPPMWTEATPEAELASLDPTYTPAEHLDDLEEIAPLGKWWEQPGHWGEESDFRGFGRTDKVVDRDLVEVYVRRALVEALVLKAAGEFPAGATKKWPVGEREQLDSTLALEIEVRDGKATLKGDVQPLADSLLGEVSSTPEPVQMVSVSEAREMVKGWENGWKDITLTNDIKFALRKRLYQLTGNLIPDSKFGAASTVRHIITLGSKQPPATKLAEVLERRGDLPQLSNVTVHERKIGMIDKEVAVGRWKVIEEELQKRDLPVLGTANLPRRVEQKWMAGGS